MALAVLCVPHSLDSGLALRTSRVTEHVELLRRNVKRFRGGLAFKANRLVYHSSL